MISTMYISKAFEKTSSTTKIIRKKNTDTINLLEVKVKKGNRSEIFRIYTSPFFEHKVFIELKSSGTSFTRDEMFEAENTIMEGVLKTPENAFTNLINPIYFDSANFFNLNQESISKQHIQDVLEEEVFPELEEAAKEEVKEKKSMFGFAYPRCRCEDLLNDFFNESKVVLDVSQEKDKNMVYFFSFKEHWSEEKETLEKMEERLKRAGIEGEVCFALSS